MSSTCISDLHPCIKGTDRRKIFDDEADGLGRRGKATIAEPRPRTTLALCREQFGRQFVVKGHGQVQLGSCLNRNERRWQRRGYYR